jgi:crotonobetainyl-CoA:carnitine CoA-transferase CaiB-like acyl-CoA transferase
MNAADTPPAPDPRPPALAGLRVFDLSQGVAGPYCTMLMAAQGAEVIKVEPPEGDWLRRGRNLVRGHSPAALTVNAGKRSLVLNPKQAEARAVAQQLAARCDVLVESFRPGVVERLGLGASALRARAPDLVHVSISGFGRGGALAQRAVIDHVAQAYSGWMSVNADADGVPQRTRNVVLADQVTGLYAYEALASALIRRLRFGGGEAIEVTLAGAMAAFLAPRIATQVLSAGRAGPAEFMAPSGDYRTAEGLLTLAVLAPDDVARLCAALGRPDWLEDPRFATPAARLEHAAALRAEVQAVLATRTAAQWEADLAGRGLMACRVRDIAGFLQSQAGDGLDLVDSVEMPGLGDCPLVNIPGAPRWAGRARPPRAPALGEHSREILRDAGIDEALIGRLAG